MTTITTDLGETRLTRQRTDASRAGVRSAHRHRRDGPGTLGVAMVLRLELGVPLVPEGQLLEFDAHLRRALRLSGTVGEIDFGPTSDPYAMTITVTMRPTGEPCGQASVLVGGPALSTGPQGRVDTRPGPWRPGGGSTRST